MKLTTISNIILLINMIFITNGQVNLNLESKKICTGFYFIGFDCLDSRYEEKIREVKKTSDSSIQKESEASVITNTSSSELPTSQAPIEAQTGFKNTESSNKIANQININDKNVISCPLNFKKPEFNFLHYRHVKLENITLKKSSCYKSTKVKDLTQSILLENDKFSFIFFVDPNSKIKYDSKLDFLKKIFLQTYDSNKGNTIFELSGRTYIISNNPINVNFVDSLTNSDYCEKNDLVDNEKILWSNCIDKQLGTPNDTWFKSNFRYNFCIWFVVFFLLAFFIWTLMLNQNEELNPKLENNNLTIHPLYSILNTGSDVFTKKSRITSFFMTLVSSMFMISLLNFFIRDDTKLPFGAQIPVFIIVGIIFTFPINHINGYLLNKIKLVNLDFISNCSKCYNYDVKKKIEENYLNDLTICRFIYYFSNFILFCIFTPLSCYFINYKTSIDLIYSFYWFIEVLVAWVVDIWILDFICVSLAKVTFLKKIFMNRGFYYDYKLQNNYESLDFDMD